MNLTRKISILFLFAFVLIITKVEAQGPPPPPPPPPAVPLDGGISLLIAAGVAYGSKKVMDKRKKNSESEVE